MNIFSFILLSVESIRSGITGDLNDNVDNSEYLVDNKNDGNLKHYKSENK